MAFRNRVLGSVNSGLFTKLREEAKNSFKSGRHTEALAFQFQIMEVAVRSVILIELKRDDRKKKYWDSEETYFGTLIDYLELIGVNEDWVSRLRTYRNRRNDVVHKALTFKSYRQLNEHAKKTFEDGDALHTEISDYVTQAWERIKKT
jgi:hypothetical protein